MEEWTPQEQELYKQARALKQQAREMRKKRIAEEKFLADQKLKAAAAAKVEEDLRRQKEAKLAKDARDQRIRDALLKMATIVKDKKLAFDAPFGWSAGRQPCFKLHDKETGQVIQIYSTNSGFFWD